MTSSVKTREFFSVEGGTYVTKEIIPSGSKLSVNHKQPRYTIVSNFPTSSFFYQGIPQWQSFSASFINTDSTADIGNGSNVALWRMVNLKNVSVRWLINIGTTTTFGTGFPGAFLLIPLPNGYVPNGKAILDVSFGPYGGTGVIPAIVGATTGSSDMFMGFAVQSGGLLGVVWPSLHTSELNGKAGEVISVEITYPV